MKNHFVGDSRYKYTFKLVPTWALHNISLCYCLWEYNIPPTFRDFTSKCDYMSLSPFFRINVMWVQDVIIIITVFCWHYFESCYAGNWYLAMTHQEAVSHLLKSERHIFSEMYVSQKNLTIFNMNVIFLSLEDAVWNSEDWQRTSHSLDLLFFSRKTLLRMWELLSEWRVTVHTRVYNRKLLCCHLDVRRCWATQRGTSEKIQ